MTDSDQAALPPARAPSRLGLYVPFAIFLLICLAWTGFWFYARFRAEQALDAWLALEQTAGRQWTCPDREIGGYPFRMEITCSKPTFSGTLREPGGETAAVTGSLGGFSAEALVYDPGHLIASLKAPLRVRDAAGRGADIDWQQLQASVEGRPGALGLFSLVATAPKVVIAGAAEPVASAGTLEVHLRHRTDDEAGAYDFALSADKAQVPLLDALGGSGEPASLTLQGRASKLGGLDARNMPAALEAWRKAGGDVQIAVLKLQKGSMSIDGVGDLRLDEAHYPQGQIETRVTGADQLLAQFGLGGRGMQIGGILGSLLGGKASHAGAAPGPGLKLSLRFSDGRVNFGPFGWALKPLY